MRNFSERPAPGTKVRVEFEGVVEPEPHDGYPRFWQVCVADRSFRAGGRIHYINWESDTVTKLADPEPEPPRLPDFWPPQDQDVWRTLFESDYYVDNGQWFSPRMHEHYPIEETPTAWQNWRLVYRKGVVEAA